MRFSKLPIFLLLTLTVGCTVHGGDDKYRSGDDHIASIQMEAADAKWELLESKKAHGAFNHVGNIQQHASGAAVDFTEAAHQYGELVKKTDREHESTKWIGWQTRAWRDRIILAWFLIGAFGVVAPFIGLGWLSVGIMRFLPFSNLFAGVRDWIQKRKDANTPSVTVNLQNPQAVRDGAQQVADAINAAGPATTPSDAAVT